MPRLGLALGRRAGRLLRSSDDVARREPDAGRRRRSSALWEYTAATGSWAWLGGDEGGPWGSPPDEAACAVAAVPAGAERTARAAAGHRGADGSPFVLWT